jgi:DNA-binding CsgD family transcriptional regulator
MSVTPRELEVLRLLAEGNDVNQISDFLELSSETIRTHIKKIQRKLGARNRLQAVAQALRLQLIT